MSDTDRFKLFLPISFQCKRSLGGYEFKNSIDEVNVLRTRIRPKKANIKYTDPREFEFVCLHEFLDVYSNDINTFNNFDPVKALEFTQRWGYLTDQDESSELKLTEFELLRLHVKTGLDFQKRVSARKVNLELDKEILKFFENKFFATAARYKGAVTPHIGINDLSSAILLTALQRGLGDYVQCSAYKLPNKRSTCNPGGWVLDTGKPGRSGNRYCNDACKSRFKRHQKKIFIREEKL